MSEVGLQAGQQKLNWSIAYAVLFNVALAAWLLLKPGPHAFFTAVDNIVQLVGPLMLLLVFVRPFMRLCRRQGTQSSPNAVARLRQVPWAALMLWLGALIAYTDKAWARQCCMATTKAGAPCRAYAGWDDPGQRCVNHAGRHHTGPMGPGFAPDRRGRYTPCKTTANGRLRRGGSRRTVACAGGGRA